MGIGKSTAVDVRFNRPSSLYYAGEQITGNISLYNSHKKLTLNQIHLEFIGEFGYTTKDSHRSHDGTGHSQIENHTVYHKIPFIHNRYLVFNTNDNQNETILKRGHHSWPFAFTLPECLPPSTAPSTDSYPYVKYYTRIVIDKPWYQPNAKQVYPLTIFPNVDLSHLPGQQAVSASRRNRKYLQLKVSVPHHGISSGQNIHFSIDVDNPKRLQVKRVEASLIQHRQVAQHHHAEVICRMDLPNLRDFNGTGFHRNFDLRLPYNHLPPTCNYNALCSDSLICTDIHYELKLTVRVYGTLTEMHVSIPIIIGTESSSNRYQLQRNNFIEMPTTDTAALEDIDSPPSYESVIKTLNLKQFRIVQ